MIAESSHGRTRFLHSFLLLNLLVASTVFAGTTTEEKLKFKNLQPILDAIKQAPKFALFQGIPRAEFRNEKPAVEQAAGKTVQLHGYTFYSPGRNLSDEKAKAVAELVAAPLTFVEFSGEKKCDGFHPDYCLEWTRGADTYRILLCFGCHEAKIFGPSSDVRCDIPREAFAKFQQILQPAAPKN